MKHDEIINKLLEIFLPDMIQNISEYKKTQKNFVHYTTAENGIKIIKNKEIWFRNTSVMNDFMEVRYGLDCLKFAYHSETGKTFQSILESISKGISTGVAAQFDAEAPKLLSDTFLFCISEHLEKEETFGRLSMWRAYGATAGVALVLNSEPFFQENDELDAHTVKVSYSNHKSSEDYLKKLYTRISENIDFLKTLPEDIIIHSAFLSLKFHVLCTKHQGFEEEKEWRVIFNPVDFSSVRHFKFETDSVRGIPQIIAKFPLQNDKSLNLSGVDIPNLIRKVIIGPCEASKIIATAYVKELSEAGVDRAAEKVTISHVPLRH